MPRPKPNSIDEYLTWFTGEKLEMLQKLRAVIKKALPKAEETISYAIPCYKQNGSYVIYFSGFDKHYSLYPIPKDRSIVKEIAPHKKGKGTLQFSWDKPVPVGLVTKIAKAGLKDNVDRTSRK